MQEKFGFVYIWFDKYRKMFYIGCHWGYENDRYICSSNRMRLAYYRRPSDFKRRIIKKIYTTKADMFIEEANWLDRIKKEELGKRYYNLTKNAKNHYHGSANAKATYKKISDTMKEKHHDPEYKKIYMKGRKKLRGRKQSAEIVEKRRQAILNGKKSDPAHQKEVSNKMKDIWQQRREGKLPMPIHERN